MKDNALLKLDSGPRPPG